MSPDVDDPPLMAETQPNARPAVRWHAQPAESGSAPEPLLHSWLTTGGLLTKRLQQLGGEHFRLEELGMVSSAAAEPGAVRRVMLWCGQHACVYAETKLPAGTVSAYPWLATLGDAPLGNTLSARLDARRGAFEYALLTPGSFPAQLPGAGTQSLWARRSAFLTEPEPLTVTEIFLPGLLIAAQQSLRAAD
jgi:chorismate-pyruvate lyase